MTKSSFQVEGVANSLWNEEAAPVEHEDRSWTASRMAFVWAAIAVSLPAWLFASGMVAMGMSVATLLGSVLMGSLIVTALAIGCGHAGLRYGIPFAVLARTTFGVQGARVPVALRLLVGCAWVGIGSWLGGEAIHAMLRLVAPALPQTALWMCFAAFLLVVAVPSAWNWKLVTGVLLGGCFLLLLLGSAWVVVHIQGLAVLAPDPALSPMKASLTSHEVKLCMTGLLGLWLPVALGASDLSRRIRSERAQVLSLCAVPVAVVVFCGLTATLAAQALGRGWIYWDPALLGHGMTSAMAAFGCLVLTAAVALLTARPVCGWLGTEIAGLMPSHLSDAAGRWLTCLVAILSMPWRWIATPQRFVSECLPGYAGLLAPVAAILLVEYFVLRRQWLNVDDLYQRDGLYEYDRGWNGKAFGALAVGWLTMGLLVAVPSLAEWRGGEVWIGTGISAVLYWMLRSGPPDVAQIPPTPLLIPLVGFESEGASG